MKTDGRTLEVEVAVRPPANRKRQPQPAENEPPRIPRITRLMALAIKFQDMVDRGEVRDYADLARLGYVTRARLTQIMNLLLLAPDIQEDILGVGRPTTAMTERQARSLVKLVLWQGQRQAWAADLRQKLTEATRAPWQGASPASKHPGLPLPKYVPSAE